MAINKKLLVDIANQSRLPYATVSADVSNCFDRVAHPILALSCSHFGLSKHYIEAFFTIIQQMKIYLLTAHGISSTFYTSTHLNSFQGLIQGNGAAFPGFLIIAVLLIWSL